MFRAIAVRILSACGILMVVSFVVFFGIEGLPGDAAQAILGRQATPELLAQYRSDFGLDQPPLERYVEWLTNMATGDLGQSYAGGGQAITTILGARLENTLVLAAATAIFLFPLALLLGVYSAVQATKPPDQVIGVTTLAFISMPEFVIGTLVAALLAVGWAVFPATSLIDSGQPLLGQLDYLALPTLTLVLSAVAQATRMIRATMIDVLRSDYIEMAVLKGVPRRRVLFSHALPNALGPTLQILAFTLAWLVGGVITVEVVFGYPGIGQALVNAVRDRDFAVVEAIVMMATSAYVLLILAADIAAIILNPRLRRSAS